jgi:hypothetical protein
MTSVPGDRQQDEMLVIGKLRTSIMEDSRLTIRETADEVGNSRGSANTILTENMGT